MRNRSSNLTSDMVWTGVAALGLFWTTASTPLRSAVIAWGYNGYGQTNAPSELGNAVAIAGGGAHSLALRADGTVAAWGDKTFHQTNVPAGLTNVAAISAGASHSLALLADGTVVGWGDDWAGKSTPPPDLGRVVGISAGGGFSLALKPDGTVVGWGSNDRGERNIPSELTNVVAIAAGGGHGLAVKADGTVVAWGDNFYGQTNVPAGLRNVVAIRAGANHGLALTTDGTVVAWGENGWGEGNVPPGLDRGVGIGTGADHNLVIRPDGAVFAWGLDSDGEAEAPPGLTNVVAVSGGDFHSLALVGEGPPFLTTPLLNRTCGPGGTSLFYVEATGEPPLSFQWKLNGVNLVGETGTALVLTNVQDEQTGSYQVEVRNQYGTAKSAKAVLALAANRGCPALLPGMVAWWAGENDGRDPVGGNDATLMNGVTFQPGEVGNAFEFHGTNQYMIVADAPALNPTNGFTLEAWVYPALAPHVWATILSKADGSTTPQYELHLVKTGEARAVLYGDVATLDGGRSVQGTHEIPLDAWTHVAMSYDATNLNLYVNGILEATQRGGVPALMRPTKAPLYIGGSQYFLFDGRIDELSIYNRALSAPQLLGIYAAGAAGKCAVQLPPLIISQPQPMTVPVGGDASLSVKAQPGLPADSLSYQWLWNATNLPGETHESLTVSHAQPWQAGLYSVVVKGTGGAVTSSPAMLSVVGMTAWGVLDDQQTLVPWGLTDVVAIAAGCLENMALRTDGTVVVTGSNGFGQTNVPPGLSNVVAMAAGSQHCLALTGDGSVVAWGHGTSGWVPADLTNIAAIAAGPWHNLALRGDGRVFAWGDNDYGQTDVPADATNVIAIAAGLEHSLALRADGTLRAWGNNIAGVNDIPAGLSPVVAIACGSAHNLALLADGTVAAWGARINNYGQTVVPAGLSDVAAIAAGEFHSLALKSDGTLVAWGATWDGITTIPSGLKNVVAISASQEHSLALIGDGPPFLTAPLMNRTGTIGGTSVFRGAFTGTSPMSYQWTHSGVWLDGETKATLILTNIQPSQEGVYQVMATNSAGVLVSFGGELRVSPIGSCLRAALGLVGWWRGDNDTRDECTGAFGSLPYGQVAFSPGEVGQGFAFAGSGAGVFVYNPSQLQTTDLTIETWIRRSSPSSVSLNGALSSGLIFGYDQGGYKFSLDSIGQPLFSVGELRSLSPAHPISDTNFHHLAVTKAGSGITFYVDGTNIGMGNIDPSLTFPGQAWIGGLGGREGFYGTIDELGIYDRALSSQEIYATYRAGTSGGCLTPLPPVITMQPTNQMVAAGGTLWMTALAAGTEPLCYQWYFNGTSIAGARSGLLVVTNILLAQAGSYCVAISNAVGCVISKSAQVTVASAESVVQAVGGTFDSGTTVTIPIQLVGDGNENAVAFSLNFSPSTLHYLDVQPGNDTATATLMINTNRAPNGSLGIALALPGGRAFSPGTQELATVTFSTPIINTTMTTELTFGDSPAKRQVVDLKAGVIPAAFIGGTVVIAPVGYEGDVAPHPHGDGEITVADWAQLGRFVARLDSPTNSSEFRRADCAPRNTLGDGVIGLADWVQAGRYAIGLDPIDIAGGPGSVNPLGLLKVSPTAKQRSPKEAGRRISISRTAAAPNEAAVVTVNLESLANENAVAFSIAFDPAALKFERAATGLDATHAWLNINSTEARSGRLAFVLALPPGSHGFEPGSQDLLKITFQTAASAAGSYPLRLTDAPVSREICSTEASPLAASYIAGAITVGPRPRLRVTRSGEMLTISWPLWATNAELQQSAGSSLPLGAWTVVPTNPSITNGEWNVTLPHSGSVQFYRLMDQ